MIDNHASIDKLIAQDGKKTKRKLILLICIIIPPILFFASVVMKWRDVIRYGDYELGINSFSVCAGHIFWDGDVANTEFTVPDTYDGRKVTVLGDRDFPLCFSVHIPSDVLGYDKVSVNKCIDPAKWPYEGGVEYREITLTINIGKNISKISYVTFDEYRYITHSYQDENGDYKYDMVCKVLYYFKVNPENKTFYSENGRVYWRRNGMEVGEFIFAKR